MATAGHGAGAICMSMASRFLFIAGENELLTMGTMLKNSVALSNTVNVLFVSVMISQKINSRHDFWSTLCTVDQRAFTFLL